MRQPLVNIGIQAATRAGAVITRYANRLDQLSVQEKEGHDFVTEVDRAAEKEILHVLQRAYPNIPVVTEEAGTVGGDDKLLREGTHWIVDPLDGTTNFIHGVPHYSISLAYQEHGELHHGVIFDPVRNELFSASRGGGAYCNETRMRISERRHFDQCLLATGFPFKRRQRRDRYMAIFGSMFDAVADMRRAGSAALDLAYVAAGRLDGFWEMGLSSWDIAAGALLVREAGGTVCDFTGGKDFLDTGDVIAGSIRSVAEMRKIIDANATSE